MVSVPWLMQATKDYNVGEPPDPRAVQIAEELGLQLREGATARLIDHAKDIVQYDLVLCFDKVGAVMFAPVQRLTTVLRCYTTLAVGIRFQKRGALLFGLSKSPPIHSPIWMRSYP